MIPVFELAVVTIAAVVLILLLVVLLRWAGQAYRRLFGPRHTICPQCEHPGAIEDIGSISCPRCGYRAEKLY